MTPQMMKIQLMCFRYMTTCLTASRACIYKPFHMRHALACTSDSAVMLPALIWALHDDTLVKENVRNNCCRQDFSAAFDVGFWPSDEDHNTASQSLMQMYTCNSYDHHLSQEVSLQDICFFLCCFLTIFPHTVEHSTLHIGMNKKKSRPYSLWAVQFNQWLEDGQYLSMWTCLHVSVTVTVLSRCQLWSQLIGTFGQMNHTGRPEEWANGEKKLKKRKKKGLTCILIILSIHKFRSTFYSTLLRSVHLFLWIYFFLNLSGDFTGPSIQEAIIFFSFFVVLCIIHSLIELQCWSVFGFDH